MVLKDKPNHPIENQEAPEYSSVSDNAYRKQGHKFNSPTFVFGVTGEPTAVPTMKSSKSSKS